MTMDDVQSRMPQDGEEGILQIPARWNAELGAWIVRDQSIDRPTLALSVLNISSMEGHVVFPDEVPAPVG